MNTTPISLLRLRMRPMIELLFMLFALTMSAFILRRFMTGLQAIEIGIPIVCYLYFWANFISVSYHLGQLKEKGEIYA